jgi:glycosyltransferase involved in cell wall biosynthesis
MLTVSVIIPTYNRAHLVGRAIRSALANVEPGDEILVIDDASTDNTAEVVAAFGDPVRLILAPHGGAGAARNAGLSEARGDLVAFLDSDDEWYPGKLRLQRALLEQRPDVLFCFGNFRSKEESGAEEPFFLQHWHRDPRPWDEILSPGVLYSSVAPLPDGWADFRVHVGSMFLPELLSDYIATTTVVTRRVEAGDALSFGADLPTAEDKECFAKLAGRGPGAYFDAELSIQWGHAGPRVTDARRETAMDSKLKLLARVWERDADFMARHGETLRAVRRDTHLRRARWLLARGRTAEARQDLQQAGQYPLVYRLLAAVPGPVARPVILAGRFIRSRVAAT